MGPAAGDHDPHGITIATGPMKFDGIDPGAWPLRIETRAYPEF